MESSPFDFIVGTNAETIPEVGVLSALHCAVVMGIRFGMRTQRILQRAATPGPGRVLRAVHTGSIWLGGCGPRETKNTTI